MPTPPRELPAADPAAQPDQLDRDRAVATAGALRPRILAEASDTEARHYPSPELHIEFAKAGLYNMMRPATFGGYELPAGDYMAVVRELARGDMSIAWCFTLSSGHVLWLASWWPERAQREIFAEPFAMANGTSAPTGRMRRVDGGWIVDGRFPYGSGGAYATHFLGHGLEFAGDGPPTVHAFVLPRAQWTLDDDWGRLLGLRGSSSHTVVVHEQFVPRHMVLEGQSITDIEVDSGTPGYRLHRNPVYNGRGIAFFSIELANLAVGGALAMLDEYENILRTKKTALPPQVLRGAHPAYQLWYADAATALTDAVAGVGHAADLFLEYSTRAAKGEGSYSLTDDAHIGRLAFAAQQKAWRAVEGILMRTAGSSALERGSRTERIWRDLCMVHSHQNSILQDITAPSYAAGKLGLSAS